MSYLIWLCTVCQCPIKWWINPCPAETGYVIFRKESKSRISWLNLVNTSVDMRSRSDCFPDSIRFHWKTEVNVPYSYLCSRRRVKALISSNLIKTRSTLTMSAGRSDTDPWEVIFSDVGFPDYSIFKSTNRCSRFITHFGTQYTQQILAVDFQQRNYCWIDWILNI